METGYGFMESDSDKSNDESLEQLLGLKKRPTRAKNIPAWFHDSQFDQEMAESILEEVHSEYKPTFN